MGFTLRRHDFAVPQLADHHRGQADRRPVPALQVTPRQQLIFYERQTALRTPSKKGKRLAHYFEFGGGSRVSYTSKPSLYADNTTIAVARTRLEETSTLTASGRNIHRVLGAFLDAASEG
ncbi:hypothetical protein E4U34_006815 [Claviceps purpurea]|nr:hypothetical protein E4U34_006815 [Claviceps purpurea]